jgi:hypothetical protein
MSDATTRAADRVRAAVKADMKALADIPNPIGDVNPLTKVVLGDVGKIIDAIPADKRGAAEWINDLAVGVKNNTPTQVAWQTTSHLAELLEVYDATRPPADPVKAEEAKPDGAAQ